MEHILQTIITAFIGAIMSAIIGYLVGRLKNVTKQRQEDRKILEEKNNALSLGIQALLRAQMINDFNKWSDKGHAPIYARENFQNCWNQYEKLGANGVMNDIKEKFFRLPIIKKEE